ncbi:MAG: thiolase family protein [Deltaproteobacteria bacterium]|nr:thiolase family protein [Deltaproteobacteria bacterium]MBN2674041.1 thiolase family protein [Deltaproteobacteria bacterium]
MKNRIEIVGVGMTRAAEEWELGLLDIAIKAAGMALDDAKCDKVDAVVVANALGGALGDQQNLALHVASGLGLEQVETFSVSCDEASGGSAVRLASALIVSGMHETILVVGAEKTSDALPDMLETVRAAGLDSANETSFGFSPTIAAALGMQQYLSTYKLDKELFFHIAKVAHAHGATNRNAMFRWTLEPAQYNKSPIVATPLSVCDNAPPCDGAAALVVKKASAQTSRVCILGSANVAVEKGIVHPITRLSLPAATESAKAAWSESGCDRSAMSFFELHDSNAFLAILSIEAVGLAEPGEALMRAAAGDFHLKGPSPLWTFGGHKSRGHAPGAGGIYQIVEAVLGLRGDAGENQVLNADKAMVQCLGSFGAQAVTHVLG